MKNFAKIFFVIIFFCFCSLNQIQAKNIKDLNLNFDKIKQKLPFKKQQQQEEQPKPKMPETKQLWEKEAQNVPLEEREIKKQEPQIDLKKYHVPQARYAFVPYNYPQGTREINIENVKKNLFYQTYLVADKNFQYAAYQRYYYSPDTNQISSNFYVEKLDTSKTKTKRILDYSHNQLERMPIIEAGVKEYYPNLFNGLSLVDWSNDSKKLLIKEKVGSTQKGIYKTWLYVHFMENEVENGYTIKLEDFDRAIKHYFLDWENKQIVKYRYDITPLGFSEENDDIIISICYVYDNDGNKLFLGVWGYDCKNQQTMLLSKENTPQKVSINGLMVKQIFD